MTTVGMLLMCGKSPNGIRADTSSAVGLSFAESRRACMNCLSLGSRARKIGSDSICFRVTMRYLRKRNRPFVKGLLRALYALTNSNANGQHQVLAKTIQSTSLSLLL